MGIPADIPARAEAAAALDVDVDPASVVDADDLRDATGQSDSEAAGLRSELPLEADPADVAEQDAAVPYDDEER